MSVPVVCPLAGHTAKLFLTLFVWVLRGKCLEDAWEVLNNNIGSQYGHAWWTILKSRRLMPAAFILLSIIISTAGGDRASGGAETFYAYPPFTG